jgi:general secretion pathway protein K
MVLGPFNGGYTAAPFGGNGLDFSTSKNMGLTGGGRWALTIVDEDSKININAAAAGDAISEGRLGAQLLGLFQPPQYDPMFEGRDADGQFSDRFTVCGAIVDWADPDEGHRFNCDPKASGAATGGAKDNIYQTLGLSYRRKDAAFDSLDELRLVRGISDDFWATFVDPDPGDPHKRTMTVWGQNNGKINVNTANALILISLTCGLAVADTELCKDPTQMSTFIMAVTLLRSLLKGAPIFLSGGDFVDAMEGKGMLSPLLTALGVKPVKFTSEADAKKQFDTKSKIFSVYADGIVPGYRRETRVRIHAVIDFRSAVAIGSGSPLLGGLTGATGTAAAPAGAAAGMAAGALSGAGAAGAAANGQMTPEQLIAAMSANPAGNIIYWRIE